MNEIKCIITILYTHIYILYIYIYIYIYYIDIVRLFTTT